MYKNNNNNIMFGSSSTQNNQMLIPAESDIVRARDEVDYHNPIENVPLGATADDRRRDRTTRRSHSRRHSRAQIQALEAFFLHCPHPDHKQRRDLSRDLGLEPLQIKFWFQNKRTKLRAQRGSDENRTLKAENEKLRAENAAYKEALSNNVQSCTKCENLSTAFLEDIEEFLMLSPSQD